MELRHLRYFVAVAEEENVTRAAARLHVSQPAVSRQIRDLEEEIGVALFRRSARALTITAPGRVFLDHARDVLRRAQAAVAAARDEDRLPPEVLHVGFSPSPTVDILAESLRAFQERHPEVKVSLHDMTSCEMLEGLAGGTLQAALMVRPDYRPVRGLHFEKLRTYRMGVLLPAKHPLAAKKSLTAAVVAKERLVSYSLEEYPDYARLVSQVLGLKKGRFQPAEECDGVTSLIAAVESGRGVAVVAESIVGMTGLRARFVPLVPAPPPLEVGVAYRKALLTPGVGRFVETVRMISGQPA